MVITLLGSCLIFGQERLTTLVSFHPELHGFHGQFSIGVNTSNRACSFPAHGFPMFFQIIISFSIMTKRNPPQFSPFQTPFKIVTE